MIVHVHFELELTLRQLRERLRLVTLHWPSYPNAVGIILVISMSVNQKEGRFNVWNQTVTDDDERLQCFIPFFHMFLRLLNLITRGGTSLPLGSYALCQGLIATLYTYLWPMDEISWLRPCLRKLGNRTIPSDHAAVRLVIHKPTHREQQCKRIPSWTSKHPVFCSILKRLNDDLRFSADPLGALAEFKAFLAKAKQADCS